MINLLLTVPIQAESTAEALSLKSTPIITFGYIMQVILSLAIVLGLLYISSRYILPRFRIATGSKMIEIVERTGLEPGLSAYILKVKRKLYLIALSQKNAVLLDKFEEGELKA